MRLQIDNDERIESLNRILHLCLESVEVAEEGLERNDDEEVRAELRRLIRTTERRIYALTRVVRSYGGEPVTQLDPERLPSPFATGYVGMLTA